MANQFWGGKLLGGYAGLHHTAEKISKYIPECKRYVEPFAGLGRLHKFIKADEIFYNDMSDFAYNYLKKNYKDATVTQQDFTEMFKHDSKDTFFLIDPVWRSEHYSKNTLTFMDRKPYEYYKKIFEIIPKLQGNWIVCGVADERQTRGYMSNHNFSKKIIESDGNVIFGKKAKTLLVSNLELNEINKIIKPEILCKVCGVNYYGSTKDEHESRQFHQDILESIPAVPDEVIEKLRVIQDDIPCDCEDKSE